MSIPASITRLSAFWRSLRPPNLLIAFLAVHTGAVLAMGGQALLSAHVWVAALSCACALAAGNLWNDLADEKLDRIAHSERALPSGALRRKQVWIAASLFAALAASLALLLPFAPGVFVLACLLILASYAFLLVKIPGIANLVVAALCGASLLLGALVRGSLRAAWDVAFLAFVLSMSRELLKDAQDMDADQRVGRKSLAALLDKRELSQVGALFLVQAPLYAIGYGLFAERSVPERVALLFCAGVGVLLLWDLLRGGGPVKERLAALIHRLRLAMLMGVLSFLIAALVGDLL